MSPRPNIYHWRSHAGAEVDFLLEHNGTFFPIEVKVKSNPSRADCSGITAFRSTYPKLKIEKGLVLAPAEKIVQISERDFAMPWDLDG